MNPDFKRLAKNDAEWSRLNTIKEVESRVQNPNNFANVEKILERIGKMIDKQKRLKQLITRCNKRLDIATKYVIDNKFSAEDYTFEYAVSDLLYDASIVKER